MQFPDTVEAYIDRLMTQRYAMFCVRTQTDYRVSEMWGNAAEHGLQGICTGDDLRIHAPYVSDLAGHAQTILPYVHTSDRCAAHVHVLGDSTGCYVVFLSATREQAQRLELQQTANEVRLLNHRQQRLIDQLIEARAELDLRRREAERANDLKSRFIASMSHEYRTPLTSIMGYAQLLAEACPVDSEMAANVAAIERASRHLLSLVNNILDQASLEDGRVEPRASITELRQVADDLAAILAPLAAEKGVAFGVYVDKSVPEFLLIDDLRTRQILLNLLGNAVKFTDEGSVMLELKWSEGIVSATVTDTGPGIAAEDSERIFEAFERTLHAEGRAGTGLGLNISMRLAHILGGDIKLDSVPGQGSRFVVTLPAAREDAPAERKARAPKAAARTGKPCVLVAEDNPDIVNLIRLYLLRAGYELKVADNGRDALSMAQREQPDLIVLDVNMPIMDGLTVARRLREAHYDGPIIALTADLDVEMRERARRAGCSSYLGKPIRMPAFLSEIERLLG